MFDVGVMGRCFFVFAQIVLHQSSSNPKQFILSLLATDFSTGFCRISPSQNCPSRGLSNIPFPWVEQYQVLIPSERQHAGTSNNCLIKQTVASPNKEGVRGH